MKYHVSLFGAITVGWLLSLASSPAQSTLLTYQGSLQDNQSEVNGAFDLSFGLFSAASGGSALAAVTNANVTVANGLFTTALDFAPALFDGSERWLGIGVRPTGGGAPFVPLDPRQRLTASPGSLWSWRARDVTEGAVKDFTFLGTTTPQPVDFSANNTRALRLAATGTSGAVNLIGGSPLNRVGPNTVGATIAGGGTGNYMGQAQANVAMGDYASIGGGLGHTNRAWAGTIGGGHLNLIQPMADGAVISGGTGNVIEAEAKRSVIDGGQENYVTNALLATIGGGEINAVFEFADYSAIGGGFRNTAENNAIGSTIAGGFDNYITNAFRATIGGGESNTVYEFADFATIPGGWGNVAAGQYSFAAGLRAVANHNGAFVWGDATDADIASNTENQFTVRASGGVRFFTDSGATVGAELPAGDTGWQLISDRNLKENFETVDAREVLAQVAALPIQRWNMKTQNPSVRHIGPMAQDFHSAFGLGQDDRHINSVDADGVALAAIQGLNQKLEEKEAEIRALREAVAELKEMVRELNQP